MRHLLSLSLFFFLPVLLLAQDKYQLFYAPNAYNLTPKQQADLSKILQARPLSVLKIQPFTDDLGSDIDNEVLAENRAKTIIQFVQKQGFEQLQFEQLPYERQPLDASLPVAEARQQLRRIDLYFYNAEEFEEVKNKDVWTSFYSKQRKEAQQLFSFSAQKGKFIQGKNGIQIDIPENSFLGPDGRPYQGQVSLVLQEALSMKDMILQNLSTTSNGELIETGGMIYLAAKGENGEELSLAEGKDLTVGFPGAAAALPGMQIFQGPNTADPHAEINWQPTGSQQIWNEAEKKGRIAPLDSSYFAEKEELLYLLKVPVLSQYSRDRLKPFKQSLPRFKGERSFMEFEEYLAQKYPQKAGETEESYQRRIRKKKIKLRKQYNDKKRSWQKKYRAYQKDSSYYAKARSRYEAEQQAYHEFLDKEHQEAKELFLYLKAFSHEHLAMLFFREKERLYTVFDLDDYGRHSSILGGFQELLPLYQLKKKVDFSLEIAATKELQAELNMRAYEKTMTIFIGFLNRHYKHEKEGWAKEIRTGTSGSNVWLRWDEGKEMQALVLKLESLIRAEGDRFSPKGHKDYLKLKKEIKKIFELDNKYWEFRTTTYSDCLQLSLEAEAEQQKATQLCKRIDSLAAEVLAKKERYGILKEEKAYRKMLSQMKVSGLGWINCDRFREEGIEKMNLTVAKASSNAQYFLVFKNINGIMRADHQARFRNVPKNYEAKLIGIRYFGDQMELMEVEDKISDLSYTAAPFKKLSPKELAAKLEAL